MRKLKHKKCIDKSRCELCRIGYSARFSNLHNVHRAGRIFRVKALWIAFFAGILILLPRLVSAGTMFTSESAAGFAEQERLEAYACEGLLKENDGGVFDFDGYGFSDELSGILEGFFEHVSIFSDVGSEEDIDELSADFSPGNVVGSILNSLLGRSGGIGGFLIMLFGVSVLLLAAELMSEYSGELSSRATAGVAMVLSIPIFSALSGIVNSVRDGLQNATELFSGLIPVFTSISAIGGGVTTAAAEAAGMSFTLSAVSFFAKDGLLPIVMLMLALGLISSFDIGGGVAPVIRGAKSFFTFAMGAMTSIVAGCLALQTLITGAKDSMALRGMKYAISGMIPIVGGSVSSALGTLASGVNLAKGTVGAVSIAALLSVLGAPLLELLLFRFAFRICISFLEITGGKIGVGILSSILYAIDMLISIFAFSSLIYILETVIFLKFGVPSV